ncbi:MULTISPECIES: helix-hairpin-helix domain-containing protein [Bacillaceae]|uniref:helix-hairpin-helix domain-containing protein n=1 Tax=Bacillaceae TaxID=186817 RepID=UPI001C55DAD6|nr:helix-hairpin-helix domain-containing protein [Rossellomorea sp. YZS02]MBW3113040.1 helix-hairpin-helix domain-containing protein [Bacillus sp. MCCB 382]MDX8341910.1 helix-hairpin-helix domain-containing protein [Rossellomorea sp. YZS02]
MRSIIEKYRTILVMVLICSVFLIAYILKNAFQPSIEESSFTAAPVKKEEESEPAKPPENVYVDVKGQVVNPGLYEVRQGDRLKFVIDRAGGFTEDADRKMINLAVKVSDEMMIYVPKVGEMERLDLPIPSSGAESGQDKLNINTASQQDFEGLPGIGPSKAASFVQYRDENGPFTAIEEITNISGIGEKTFEKLKEHIFVQ